MPDVFPQCLSFQDQMPEVANSGSSLSVKLQFPIIMTDTSKLLIQELLLWEIDLSGNINSVTTSKGVQFAASLSLGPNSSPHISGTTPDPIAFQTIGHTNIIDRFQIDSALEAVTPLYSQSGPFSRSLTKGGLGMILPQDHIYLNLEYALATDESIPLVGVRIWYRQRTVKESEYAGLLASRIQLNST